MNYFSRLQIKEIVSEALREDIGKRDVTTELTIPKAKLVKAILLTKEDCIVCGLDIAGLVFKTINNKIQFKPKVRNGQFVKKGKVLAKIEGKARSILTAERVALNFLSLLSGIATKTKSFIEAVKPYKSKIMDTRKTIPGLRELQKYAVRTGGGYNHRMRLDEMILVKDNHLKIINSKSQIPNPKQITNSKFKILKLKDTIEWIRRNIPRKIKIEIEVKNLREFREALKSKPDIIMLDNMSIKDIKKAVEIRDSLPNTHYPPPKLEASGGITLKNVRKIASCGVEMISIGELTDSVNSIDISLEIL